MRLVVILGPIRDGDWGFAVAGAIKLGFQRGTAVTFLYNARPGEFDPRFLHELAPDAAGGQVSGSIRGTATSPAPRHRCVLATSWDALGPHMADCVAL